MASRPKAWALLRYLVERPGMLVTKDELNAAIWGGAGALEHLGAGSVFPTLRSAAEGYESPAASPVAEGHDERNVDVELVPRSDFDAALASWVGAPPALCIFAETCGE